MSERHTTTKAYIPEKAFSAPDLCHALLEKLHKKVQQPFRFMEVCGSHTVAIFRSGLRNLLPKTITHLSGPGCPVCVTHDREIAASLALAAKDRVIIATFGDLMRVPGPEKKTLKAAQAEGAAVQIVYSPLDALALAKKHPKQKIVFLGVGFETTAPTIAATIQIARKEALRNFFVLPMHKLVPPALNMLLAENNHGIDAFLLPGHVSTVLGLAPYAFLADKYARPGVVGGFEPADILQSLLLMADMHAAKKPAIVNQYNRGASDTGNPKAQAILADVFSVTDTLWRGIGEIPQSGLAIKDAYKAHDAWEHFSLAMPEVSPILGCKCGEILQGRITPGECPLFGENCTPASPVGPCMVSTEGSCAAYFKYQLDPL